MVFSPCHLFARSGIPARALEVEKYARLIADDPGIMSWWGNPDITRPKIVYGTVVQHRAKVPGNDVGKMGSLTAVRACDGSHMLGPLPAWLTGHSDDGHIAKVDDFHLCLWWRARFVWIIEALRLGC
jgi:hypothetical protein